MSIVISLFVAISAVGGWWEWGRGVGLTCESDLLDGLVLGALLLLLVEVLLDVLGVDERDDAVQAREAADVLIHEEGLRHRRRVRHAGRFDDDAIQLQRARLHPRAQLVQHLTHTDRHPSE